MAGPIIGSAIERNTDVYLQHEDENMSGSWGCPHEEHGKCRKVQGKDCDPGMKGCTLSGRFVFSSEEKNRTARQKEKARKKDEPEK